MEYISMTLYLRFFTVSGFLRFKVPVSRINNVECEEVDDDIP
jgi:hypothetical protein